MAQGKKIPLAKRAEVFQYALTHSQEDTAKEKGVSRTQVRRIVAEAKDPDSDLYQLVRDYAAAITPVPTAEQFVGFFHGQIEQISKLLVEKFAALPPEQSASLAPHIVDHARDLMMHLQANAYMGYLFAPNQSEAETESGDPTYSTPRPALSSGSEASRAFA